MKPPTKDKWYKVRVITAIVLLGFILVGLDVFGDKPQSQKAEEEVHYHAGFRIYLNNEIVDFSKPEYMHLEPCAVEEAHDERDDPRERAHLHDLIGDVVHVHSATATWGDLLDNLRFTGVASIAYINNEVTNEFEIRDTIIRPYDRMLLLVGYYDNIPEKLDSVPNREKIEQAEQKTEGC